MFGERLAAAAVLGASVVIGVAYFFWSSASSSEKEAQKQPGGEALSAAVKQEEASEKQKVAAVVQTEAANKDGEEEEEEEAVIQSEARKEEKEEEEEEEEEALVVQNEALVVQNEALVVQNEALVVQNEALVVQNEALVVQNEALVVQNEVLKEEEESPDLHPEAETSEPRPVESDSEGSQVLVLGLDGAGKTSLLHCLSTGILDQDMKPTEGFNAVSINRDGLHIEFLEIGGKEELRQYWQRYLSKALLLVFVVDASDPQRFTVARKHLEVLLTSRPRLPLMVLANKQDIPSALSITDVHDDLSLSEVGERQLFLIGTYMKKGEVELSSGVQDARDLIIQIACGSK
ncbi:ADP-ribosylation factor-like protein 9 isoform X1 [Gouania willdenowi]|uniref:ADP-ribosylation factor-like protein 9 n=1 Tax=Gouania willdenowi TaxID=441366 RepID=A0A8C5N602_GOUWI|nr:ADP-ribosylation factor-like protein 9 isoform X1 [Gouania willdenowi]